MKRIYCDAIDCDKEVASSVVNIKRKTAIFVDGVELGVEVHIFSHSDLCTDCVLKIPAAIVERMPTFLGNSWQKVESKQ